MKTYISVNIVSQALILVKAIKKYNCMSIPTLVQLHLPYGISRQSALEFCYQCAWLKLDDSTISFTDEGSKISNSFVGDYINPLLWMLILESYIISCQPAWAKRIPYGRKEAFLFMNEEEQRCFEEAGLMESQDEDVISWWDGLAEAERQKKDANLNDIGRQGERLTMAYEERRTGVKPNWRSLESNLSGYDIISKRNPGESDSILIEVKTSSLSIDDAYMTISRNEWETAIRGNNLRRYLFYLWDISGAKKNLAIVNVNEMLPRIPVDNDSGKWEDVKVPYIAFKDKFSIAS